MRAFPALLLCLALGLGAPLRPDGGPETLFQPAQLFPAQGGPGVKTLFLTQGTATLVGGVGSLLLGQNLGLGFGGYSLASQLVIEVPGHKRDLGLSLGGVIVDYSLVPRKLFYLNVSTLTGIGQAFAVPRLTGADRLQANFYFIDPQFNLMLNVTREFRLGLGIGYLVTTGADLERVIGANLGGPNAQIVLYYGKL